MTLPLQTLVLETVAACNLRCAYCVHGAGLLPRRTPALIDLGLVGRVLAQVGQVQTCYPALWGEPTLHPQLLEILGAVRAHARSVVLTTNGTQVDERTAAGIARRVDRVLVGFPAATAATYAAICGADQFDAAVRGLRLLAAELPQATSWVYVVTRANEHEIDAARALAAQLGVDLLLKPAWLLPGARAAAAAARALGRYDAAGTPRVDPHTCRAFWEALQVLADGRVTTCCYDFGNEVVVGDAGTQHVIDDIWHGAAYAALRAEHTAGRLAGFCQRNCGMVP